MHDFKVGDRILSTTSESGTVIGVSTRGDVEVDWDEKSSVNNLFTPEEAERYLRRPGDEY